MHLDSSQVSACLDSGVGNINGNPNSQNGSFVNAGSVGEALGFHFDGKNDGGTLPGGGTYDIEYTRNGDSGTWEFDASFWLTHTMGAIGFKFGTGNEPDEWFVYKLVDGVTSGDWLFDNVFGKGGGLSHVNLYGITGGAPGGATGGITGGNPGGATGGIVPEPASLLLLGLGSAAYGLSRRRKSRA